MQRHPENQQHHQHGTDAVDDSAVLNGGEFFVGHRNRPGQPHPRAIFPGEIEIFRGLPDRVAAVLAGLQRIEVEDRLEFDEGSQIRMGQRLVADKFAPGEGRGAVFQDLFDGLRNQLNGRSVLSRLTWPR